MVIAWKGFGDVVDSPCVIVIEKAVHPGLKGRIAAVQALVPMVEIEFGLFLEREPVAHIVDVGQGESFIFNLQRQRPMGGETGCPSNPSKGKAYCPLAGCPSKDLGIGHQGIERDQSAHAGTGYKRILTFP